jgi:hypothetical protein
MEVSEQGIHREFTHLHIDIQFRNKGIAQKTTYCLNKLPGQHIHIESGSASASLRQ